MADRRGRDWPAGRRRQGRCTSCRSTTSCAGSTAASGVQRWKMRAAVPADRRTAEVPAKRSLSRARRRSVQAFSTQRRQAARALRRATELSAPPYLFADSARVFPVLVTITSDIVGRATVTGTTRDIEPAISPLTPLPNAETDADDPESAVRPAESVSELPNLIRVVPSGRAMTAPLCAPTRAVRGDRASGTRLRPESPMYANASPRTTSAMICSGITARPTSGTNAISPSPDHASADTSVAPISRPRMTRKTCASSANSARMNATTARNASAKPTLSAAIAICISR